MDIVISVELIKHDLDDGGTKSREQVRLAEREEVIQALNPLLEKGWRISVTNSRINR